MPTPTAPYYRLRLKSLKFISAVDAGAQGAIANVALIKRAPVGDRIEATCRVVKVDEHLGLVFGWALASSLDGGATPHVDLQQDAIIGDDELIKVAAEFMEQSAASDVLHDDNPDGKVVFCMPLTKDVSAALGVASKVHGLAIAMRPSPATFKRFLLKELNAFSIAGTGIRELVKAGSKCPSCDKYGEPDSDGNCQSCGKAMKRARRPGSTAPRGVTVPAVKAALTTADRDALPDRAFLYVEAGGSKDEGGKTTPRSLRHFPYRTSSGAIDVEHLRAAVQDIPKSSLPADKRDELRARAEKLLGAQHGKAAKRGLRKQVVLTSIVDGHQHQIDLDDPADEWRSDQLTTSYNTADGADNGHSHAWVYDEAGKITIAQDSGHDHTVDAVVPADVIRQAKLNEDGERCRGCGEMCEKGCRFCPGCGAAIGRPGGGAPGADPDGDRGGAAVVVISARAPRAISTPAEGVSTVKGENKEPTAMADQNELTALRAENALLKNMATLTDAQRAHHDKLVAKGIKSEADGFLVLAPAQRNVVLAELEKSNSEVYTSKSTGKVYRQNDHLEIIEAAKQADAMAETMKRLETKERDFEFAKRGMALLAHFAKGAKDNLRARIMKAVDAEFQDPAERAEAERALKQADGALEELTKAHGFNPNVDAAGADATPIAKFNAGLETFAKAAGKPVTAATADFMKTAEGSQLYAAAFPYSH